MLASIGVLCKIAAEVQYCEQAIIKTVGASGQGPGKVLQSLDYLGTLLKSLFRKFLRFLLSTFEGKETLKVETIQTLWNPIIIASDERRDKRERNLRALVTRRAASCS